jgi:hypothetical protein
MYRPHACRQTFDLDRLYQSTVRQVTWSQTSSTPRTRPKEPTPLQQRFHSSPGDRQTKTRGLRASLLRSVDLRGGRSRNRASQASSGCPSASQSAANWLFCTTPSEIRTRSLATYIAADGDPL